MKKCIVLFATMMLLSSMAFALNPVTVGPTGDYATIEDAISSWCVGGANAGETPPFVIQIDPSVSYDEALCLDDAKTSGNIVGDLEMKSATAGTKAVIKLQRGIGGVDDGLYVYQSRFDIEFTDLVFCPSQTGTVVTDDFIKVDENGSTTPETPNRIDFIDCIFTDIDGAGDPMVMSKQEIIDANYPTSLTAYVSGSSFGSGDMLLKWWGDTDENLSGSLINCGFFIRDGYCARINLDGQSGETFEIKDCVAATGRSWHAAFQTAANNAGSSFLVHGTANPCGGDLDKCTAILSAGWHAIWGGGASGANTTIKNVLIDNDDVFGTDDSCCIAHGSSDLIVEDVIANIRTDPGMIVCYPTNISVPDTFKRFTHHMEATTPRDWLYTGTIPDPGGIEFIDCVISGAGVGDWQSLGSVLPGQGITLKNCVVATSGADAITTLGVNLTLEDCKFIDPAYASKDRNSEGFMDPTDSSLLFAGTDHIDNAYGQGVSLGGGGDYSGGPDASDIANNAFKDWGDCEGDIFTIPSARGNWQVPAIYEAQRQARGVNGLGLMINYTWGRFEGGTDIEPISFTDGGEELTFYFKSPSEKYSYPRFALRLDPNDPGTNREVGDCAQYIEWQNSSQSTNPLMECDGIWHLYRPDISGLDFSTASTANFYTNNYAVPEQYLDEIVLVDTAEAITEVQEWGLF